MPKTSRTSKITKHNNATDDESTPIPRPLNCFLLYRLEKQKEIVAKCSGANHRDISKIIAKWWQEADEEEKRPFRERARIAKIEHRKLYPDYKYAPKKKVNPKRVYIRKNKKEEFTSREKENNKIMEMIYKDPAVLETITEEKKKFDCAVLKQKSLKKVSVSKKRVDNTVVMMENIYEEIEEEVCSEDEYKPGADHPSCAYASSVSSYQSVPDYQFSSQATSPYTDSYSESDMSSPYADQPPFEFNMDYFPTTLSSHFTVLDSPITDESNAYTFTPLEEQLAYFQLSQSNMVKTEENCWNNNELPYDFSAQLYQDSFMQMEQPIKYIDPAMLQL